MGNPNHLSLDNNQGSDNQWFSNKSLIKSTGNIFKFAFEILKEKSPLERGFIIFWLCGPFILLIERSPADLWLTTLALAFIVRSYSLSQWHWFSFFWVRAAFIFWGVCLLSSALSGQPAYSLTEALIWFRFPLFGMAVAFWLGRDKALLYLMLFLTASALCLMCGILAAELIIEGQKSGRLSWPYGDLVSGNYIAKVSYPAYLVLAAVAVSLRGKIAWLAGLLVLITLIMTLLTGERINFLIVAAGGMLSALVWRPIWSRFALLVMLQFMALISALTFYSKTFNRFTTQLINSATDFNASWLSNISGGIEVGNQFPILGIGTANYRDLSHIILAGHDNLFGSNHPHNFYAQFYAETGILGVLAGSIFLGSIIVRCFVSGKRERANAFAAISFIVPFSFFWPISTSPDFFGQWNNVFMWSSISLALASTNIVRLKK